jgi:hypothetical protein
METQFVCTGGQMIKIDGKTVDTTKFKTWGELTKIHSNAFIEQRKDGVITLVERVQNYATKDQPIKGS